MDTNSQPVRRGDHEAMSSRALVLKSNENLDSDLVLRRFIRSAKAGSLGVVLNNRRPLCLKLLTAGLGERHLVCKLKLTLYYILHTHLPRKEELGRRYEAWLLPKPGRMAIEVRGAHADK